MSRIATLLILISGLLLTWSSAGLGAEQGQPADVAPDSPTVSAAQTALPTQRDWLKNMVEGLGWGYGLPDEPEDKDYLAVVSGRRSLRIEAEQAVPPSEPVAIKNYHNFGPYSGTGWISGISTATEAKFIFLLPVSGRYQLSASLRLPGHRITIGETELSGDGKDHFTRVELGQVELTAGQQEFKLSVPADGGIDYIELRAPDRIPVEPLNGWELDKPLGPDDLAVTIIRLLNLQFELPPHGKELRIEAESSKLPSSAATTTARHLGAPSGKAWVRAGAEGSSVKLSFIPPAAGVYRMSVRAVAGGTITAVLDDRYDFRWDFPPYLTTIPTDSFYLDLKAHSLQVQLPPRGGFDSLSLTPLASDGEDFLNLSGLRSLGEKVQFADLDRLLPMLALLVDNR